MLESVTIFEQSIDDCEKLNTQLQGVDFEIIPLRTGPFTGQTHAIAGGGFAFTAGNFVSDHRYRGTSHREHILLGIHYGARGLAHYGTNEALQGDLSVLQPGQEQFGSVGGIFDYIALTIDPAELEHAGLNGAGGDALLAGNAHIRPPPEVAAAACQAAADLARTGFNVSLTSNHARRVFLKKRLLSPFVLVAEHGAKEPYQLPQEPYSTMVRRAEAWLDGTLPENLNVIDLCRALGQPMRTVQRAFHDILGTGPAHYMMFYRLHRARQHLLACDPTITSVTDVALDHGFWELGRFAGLYRRTYGERPSDTLRRRM